MSATPAFGYADRLKPKKKLGGQLGAEEFQESVEDVQRKADDLAQLIQVSTQEVFFFTGAGISTALGIPDFRGPNGIWTLRKRKQPISTLRTPFEYSKPSFTHMAIAALVAAGKVKCVCSQNVDCLHLRSGVPRSLLAELHGNCFAERCEACKHEYTRDFQVETVNFRPTGRLCTSPSCGGRDAKDGNQPPALLDNVLDWDSALPDDELDASIDAAKRADLTFVLGSSLQISPANEIPTLTARAKREKSKKKGKMVIVNLQKTPKDRSAHMLVRARVDPVMARIMLQLGMSVHPYIRLDGLVVSHALLAASVSSTSTESKHGSVGDDAKDSTGSGRSGSSWAFKLAVHSVHGLACTMPMVQSVQLQLLQDSSSGSDATSLLQGPHIQILCTASPPRQPPPGPSVDQQPQGLSVGGSEAQADASVRMGDQGQQGEGSPCGGATVEARPPSSSADSVPNGGPFVFAVSSIPSHVSSVRCRICLRLVQWADPDKQHLVLPDYVVPQGSQKIQHQQTEQHQTHLHQVTHQQHQQLLPGFEEVGQRATVSFGKELCSYWAGLPSDFEVAAAMVSVGLDQLPCHAHTAPPHACKPAQLGSGAPVGTSAAGAEAGTAAGAGTAQVKPEGTGPGHYDTDIASSNLDQQSAGHGPRPAVATSGPGFQIITYIAQEQHYDAAQEWQAFVSNPPPVHLAKVRAAAEPGKKLTRGEEEAHAGALTAGLRRSVRHSKPTQWRQGQEAFLSQAQEVQEEEGSESEGDQDS